MSDAAPWEHLKSLQYTHYKTFMTERFIHKKDGTTEQTFTPKKTFTETSFFHGTTTTP